MTKKAHAQIMRAADIRQWTRKTAISCLLPLFIISFFLGSFSFVLSPKTAYAQSAEEQCAPLQGTDAYNECIVQVSNQGPAGNTTSPHPYDAAKIYQAYWAFWHCADQYANHWETSRSIEDMRDGDVFKASGDGHYRPTFLREDSNGQADCSDGGNTAPLLNDMEIDGLEYFTSDTGEGGRIYNPDGTTYRLNSSVSLETRMAHLARMVQRKTGVNVASEIAPEAQQYFVIRAHFSTTECIEARDVPPESGGTTVRIVNPDGTETTTNVLIKDNSEHVGYGLDGHNASESAAAPEMSCYRMAEILNATAGATMSAIAAWRALNPDAQVPTESTAEQEEDNSCESAGGALGWIMCPIAGLLDSVVGFLDENIRELLYVNQDYFDTDEGSGTALKKAWTQFRNIAYIILIPIMLVMVIGTALGFEVFSAYTIKKALPRMIIAIIFITLSWYICVFLVNFFNVIGGGLTNLVTAPFREINSVIGEAGRSPLKGALDAAGITQRGNGWVQSVASGTTATTLGVVGTVGALATGIASLGIIMSTLATAALVLGAIFLLLVARQMIIIALALVAPLAILAWIFPGNDKLWKLWWGSFSKLLMLYPLITLLIGVGQVFAYVTGPARMGDNQLITVIIIIAAFIMPFFFIPFAFKWAGGVFGNLAGMVNDRNRGVLDRLKKGRENMRGRHMSDAKNFGRFKGTNAVTRRLNDLGGMGTNRPTAWGTRSRLQASRSAGQAIKAAEDLKNDTVYQANQNDDKFLLALGDRDAAIAQQRAAEKEAAAARANGDIASETAHNATAAAWSSAIGNANAVRTKDYAGTKLAAIAAHSATGYNLAPGQAGYNQLAGSVIKALGVKESDVIRDEDTGDIMGVRGSQAGNFASAMNQSQYNLKNAGRTDLGGINNGAGLDSKGGIRKLSNYQRGQGKKDTYHGGAGAWLGASAVDRETGQTAKTSSELTQGIEASLAAGQTTEDSIVEWHSMLLRDYNSATDANKLEIKKQLDAMEGVRTVGDPADIARGGTSSLTARLAANRTAVSREGGIGIDPSEMESN